MTVRFASKWAVEFQSFLEFKRALGFRYHRAEFFVRALDRFLVDQEREGSHLRLDEAILAWLERRPGRKSISVSLELAVLRQFYAFLKRGRHRGIREPRWPVMPTTSQYLPEVLSKEDVQQLLRLTRELSGLPFRRIMYRALILVLFCTGMRFGEALRLRLRDLNIRAGTFFIVESKGRSRWVACHRSLCHELTRYLAARRAFAPAGPDDYLFVSIHRAALPATTASETVRRLLRRAGLKPAVGRVGPRPYDLRHAFAVHRLTRWYRAGVDLHARLPWLSAYMGHDDLLGTETYLTATPELLALASGRFKRRYDSAPLPER
jgi:site-specific recombinase XerD